MVLTYLVRLCASGCHSVLNCTATTRLTLMSEAKARAEARRQAILARGTSRLAKLTSSARGEEAANIYDGERVWHVLANYMY